MSSGKHVLTLYFLKEFLHFPTELSFLEKYPIEELKLKALVDWLHNSDRSQIT